MLIKEQLLNRNAYYYCRLSGKSYSIDEDYEYVKDSCRSPLSILYDYDKIEWKPKGRGLERYVTLLPFKPILSLGEGCTPIVTARKDHIVFKLEYLNPSGSFKDRGSLLAVTYAFLRGYRKLVEDTSGNTGISITLYSATLGIKSTIVMPREAPRGKKNLVKLLGGRVIEAANRLEASEIARKLASQGYFYINHLASPFYIEGAKTIAFEIYEETGVPETIVVPIGSGGLLLGLYKGFRELKELGLTDKMPRLIGVQGYSVAPVYEELYGEMPKGGDSSYADGIMVKAPPRLNEIVQAIRDTNGRVLVVDNREIFLSLKKLLSCGFIVEPTSAAAYAGALKAMEEEGKEENIVVVLTGSGLKMLDIIWLIISEAS